MLTKEISELLERKEFVYVASIDLNHRPYVAPKFLLKAENNFIYLVDFVLGKTWENLKSNPRASLSFMDVDNLTGYQLNGPVELINSGEEFVKIIKELHKKEINLTTERIIDDLHKEKKHKDFEVAFPDNLVIFRVEIEEIVEINPSGKLHRMKS